MTAGVPTGVSITRSVFEGIGVLGKQSSALFISLACNVSLVSSVLYSGPRAGINIDDGFCGGHNVQDNVIFDWVRESEQIPPLLLFTSFYSFRMLNSIFLRSIPFSYIAQDHGPINTWDRQLYFMPPNGQVIPNWQRLVGNFILNGPSGNRDLGNLFPGACVR